MIIKATFVLATSLSAAVAAEPISASVEVTYPTASITPQSVIIAETTILPLTNLTGENLFIDDAPVVTVQPAYGDDVTVTEAIGLEYDAVYADSVTVTESQVKLYTNLVDYDPSDDDVDPDPVAVTESDAKELSRPDVADSVVSTETAKLSPEKVLSDTLPTPTDAINKFDVALAKTDAVTAAEAIDKFDVTTQFSDSVTVTESTEKEISPAGFTDSVTMDGSNIKAFNSSVDFDPSDADVDPDPVSATDAITTLAPSLGKTDSVTMAEADAKDFEFGGFSDAVSASDAPELSPTKVTADSVTAVEGAKFYPQPVKTDTVTAADAINKFDARPVKADDVTASDAVDDFDITLTKTDSVSVTDVNVKNFTENVDYDRTDADADADPVSITELLVTNPSKPFSDSFAPSDAAALNFTKALTDSYTVTESIYTLLTLGESTYTYPDWVTASDGSAKFLDGWYSYTISGTDYYVPYTGVIGAAEPVNTVMVNGDTVLYPDESSAGLVVNFLYTEVGDTTLGGYYFNQTPISAGSIEGGDRIIL